MRQSILPLTATLAYAFIVFRWATEEVARDGRLSRGASYAILALAVLHAGIVFVLAFGGVTVIDVDRDVARAFGVAAMAAGAALTVVSSLALGSWERTFGMRTDDLVTHGPYRFLRHPGYVGWSLLLVGMAVAGRSAVALAVGLAGVLALARVGRGETRRLRAAFGERYDAYRAAPRLQMGR